MTELFIFHPDNLARCCDMIMTREEIPKIDRKEGKERNCYSWPLKLIRVSVQGELKQRYSFNKYTLITYYAGGTRMLCWQARGSSRPLGNSCEISYGPLPVGTLEKLWFKKPLKPYSLIFRGIFHDYSHFQGIMSSWLACLYTVHSVQTQNSASSTVSAVDVLRRQFRRSSRIYSQFGVIRSSHILH